MKKIMIVDDNYLSAEEAKDYGLIDEILVNQKKD